MIRDRRGTGVRSDTERLDALIINGAIADLFPYSDGTWAMGDHQAESAREVIDRWLDAMEARRDPRRDRELKLDRQLDDDRDRRAPG